MAPLPKDQYANELDRILKRFDNLDNQTVRRLIALLQDTRKEIAVTLADNPTDFERFRLTQLTSSIDDIISGFQSQLSANLADGITGASELAVQSVASPLEVIGFNTSSFNRLTPQLSNIALDFSAELVQNISDDLRKSINTQLRIATLAQKSPYQAMRDVTKALGVKAKDGVWGTRSRPEVVEGVAARAETIVRTEMTRIFNLSQSSTQQQAANIIPGLLKRWIATPRGNTRQSHLDAHRRYLENPIPVDEPFQVGRDLLMFPGDPRGSAKETINCRCAQATIVPDIGVSVTSLDNQINRELEKRKG